MSEPRGTTMAGMTAWSHRIEPLDHHAPRADFSWFRCDICHGEIAWRDVRRYYEVDARKAAAYDEAIAALRKYGSHKITCATNSADFYDLSPCDCGWKQVLGALANNVEAGPEVSGEGQ